MQYKKLAKILSRRVIGPIMSQSPILLIAVAVGVLATIGGTITITHIHSTASVTPNITKDSSVETIIARTSAKNNTSSSAAVVPTSGSQTTNAATAKPTTVSSNPVTKVPAAVSLPTNRLSLYTDPSNGATAYAAANPSAYGAGLITKEGQQPVATWFGGWNSNVTADVSSYVGRAAAVHGLPVLVAYNIPNRDCGGYSAGGAQTETEYSTWIQQFANGIGSNPAIVILEPDAVSLTTCLDGNQLTARWRELSSAVITLSAHSNTYVYIDAGHAGWLGAVDTAARLKSAGIQAATGFSLNVSNFVSTSANVAYGNQVSALVGSKHFVVDTSRNGNGAAADGSTCNPSARALGSAPTLTTGNALADAYLWVKTPWESDGNCNGGPAAGANNWPYAISLAQAAGW